MHSCKIIRPSTSQTEGFIMLLRGNLVVSIILYCVLLG